MPRQDSLTNQMRDVLRMATDAGCYDAADWIQRAFFDAQERWRAEPLGPFTARTWPG